MIALGAAGVGIGPRAAALGAWCNKALGPDEYVEKNWSEEVWTRGCYAAYMPPGVQTSYGPSLREPVGSIHWAGTETADVWNGYIDGAVRSGKRAAEEILDPTTGPIAQRAG